MITDNKPDDKTSEHVIPTSKAVPSQMPRRGVLKLIVAGWACFLATTGTAIAALVRFFFPNDLFEPPMTFKAGLPGQYQLGQVDERFKQKYGVWIVRSEEGIYALATICTHLGCTPNWLQSENKFKCPCHGSGFKKSGINFEGPAPRPLERYRIVLANDGQILVDKSRKYQAEKKEWSNPESILVV
jgi:cytochrome b6-f complex iron-sulfur subunit